MLADAMTEAASEKPDLLLDFATLTGAARVALGTEITALFANDEGFSKDLLLAAEVEADPFWRLPLYGEYGAMLKSSFADVSSASSSGYAGAITAALFLQRFVPKSQRWAHLDFMAWYTSSKPGRPEGGAEMSLRAVVAMLEKQYPRAR